MRPPAKSTSLAVFHHRLRMNGEHRNGRRRQGVAVTSATAVTGLPLHPLRILLILLNALCLPVVAVSPQRYQITAKPGRKCWSCLARFALFDLKRLVPSLHCGLWFFCGTQQGPIRIPRSFYHHSYGSNFEPFLPGPTKPRENPGQLAHLRSCYLLYFAGPPCGLHL